MQSSEETIQEIALLERIAAGDQTALGDLYDRHSRLLFGLILRILKDRAEAEEVLQEAFLQAWRRAVTYNVALGSPAGWLVGIARNRAIDRLRANVVRTRAVDGAASPTPGESPEAQVISTERRREVQRALDALPREQRELIEQAYFMGLTQSELAVRFNLPLGTVKTRVRTGLMTLRGYLQRLFIEQ
jgi:RNA polymerase sigma-70 factor (ECF subfamily)